MLQVRKAKFEDYKSIAQLHADSWKKNYRGILSDQYLDNEVEKDRLNTWHERFISPPDNQLIFVAETEGKFVGFCCVYLDEDPIFGSLIDNLHISSESRSAGIGKKLMQYLAANLSTRKGNDKLYLWVYESNSNARIAYEKWGGNHFETVEKSNSDGTVSRSCRITWDSASQFL